MKRIYMQNIMHNIHYVTQMKPNFLFYQNRGKLTISVENDMLRASIRSKSVCFDQCALWREGMKRVAIPIGLNDVEQVLRPWLGTLFLSSNTLAEGIAQKLQGHAPYRQTLETLRTEIESYMVTNLNRLTHGDMRVMLDNYRTVRLSLQDILWMTDDVMGLLFDRLTPFSMNFEKLSDYSLRVESLAAMRVLYQKYASFFSEEEYSFLIKMIKKTYPAYRYEAWLDKY